MSSQPPLESGAAGRRADDAVRNFGRRSSGITFAVMVTVLLVALVVAANQNDIIGWIIVAISAGWLVLAAVLVSSVRSGAKKVGRTLDSARADAAARRGQEAGGAAVVDEDTHGRNLKLDHSLKIVQVQRRVIAQELAKEGEADWEVVTRSLETIEMTAHNGRDMLADVVGGQGRKRTMGDDDETISGDVVD